MVSIRWYLGVLKGSWEMLVEGGACIAAFGASSPAPLYVPALRASAPSPKYWAAFMVLVLVLVGTLFFKLLF